MSGDFFSGLVNAGLGLLGMSRSASQAEENRNMQQRFAKSGIQWRVQDAQKAGIHPLYALGANTVSYSPVALGDTGTSFMSQAGQDIGRAIDAGGNAEARIARKLTLEKLQAEIDFIRARTASVQTDQIGPSVPMSTGESTMKAIIPGQGDAGTFEPDPRVALVKPPSPNVEAVKSFGYSLIRNPRLFSQGQTLENEFGDSEIIQSVHGVPSYIEALSRAMYEKKLDQLRQGYAWARKYRGNPWYNYLYGRR